MSTPTDAHTAPAQPAGLEKQYAPAQHEPRVRARWDRAKAFAADPAPVLRGDKPPYCIVIPPPNVTAALHLGHALNNTLQDILARAKRMQGYETLWMPGTDHAGIATQAVVEKRVSKEEGKRRKDFTREAFVAKIQAFKDEYEAVITNQLKMMGCSCDWDRQRFTMDPVCARAVREAFSRLFQDGLIYRGKRLVNWDPALQTAVADDECYDEEIDGAFYYLRYPLVHRVAGSPGSTQPVAWDELARRGYPGAREHDGETHAWITVATTRPETYLGDSAVAINPHDPRAKALRGLFVQLPLVGRVIPIIEDDYVVLPEAIAKELGREEDAADPKSKMATGFLKVTPAHDNNDYELGQRHNLPMINVMAPDASISDKHGWSDVGGAHVFVGKKREEARKLVVKEFEARGFFEGSKPHRHSVKHSDRSKAIVEPYLSDQWYVKVTDPRLARSANAALVKEQRTPGSLVREHEVLRDNARANAHAPATDHQMSFTPERYAKTYEQWHDGIRDWCISRQLWWGHRIPVWYLVVDPAVDIGKCNSNNEYEQLTDKNLELIKMMLYEYFNEHGCDSKIDIRKLSFNELCLCSNSPVADEAMRFLAEWLAPSMPLDGTREVSKNFDFEHPSYPALRRHILRDNHVPHVLRATQDPDVLDTWFSSALWPLSTLGWPDASLAGPEFAGLLDAFNPTSTLCTAREIITLWVSRMVMFNRYFLSEEHGKKNPGAGTSGSMNQGQGRGPVPFRDVFIHSVIQDGQGRKMSKSLGNGVDPLDIIESHGSDAMRFTLCQMTTQTQDLRMPVVKDSKTGKNTSPKFDQGRNFCNKLWNAARFVMTMLAPHQHADSQRASVDMSKLSLVDRWMLSRLARTVHEVNVSLDAYQFSAYAQTLYDLLWRDFCDWYLEAIKPTVGSDADQRAVLLATVRSIVRLLHPVMPFVTEALEEHLAGLHAPGVPGLTLAPSTHDGLVCRSGWPVLDGTLIDARAEEAFAQLGQLVEAIRQVRAQHNVNPKKKITLHAPRSIIEQARLAGGAIETLAVLETITDAPPPTGVPSTPIALGAIECRLSNLADEVRADDERERLVKLIAEKEKSIGVLQGRLSNPGYSDRAPPAMVQQTRDQLKGAQDELAALKSSLEKLS